MKFIAVVVIFLHLIGMVGLPLAANGQGFGDIVYEEIDKVLKERLKHINGKPSGTVTCPTVLCPDADWNVDITINYRFTKKPQPILTPLGPSPWMDGFRIDLKDAVFEITVYADAYIDIHGPAKNIDFDVTLNKLIRIDQLAVIYTEPQPELEPDSIGFSLSAAGGNFELDGLHGDLTILGLEAGAVTGLVLTGNAFTGGILGAVLGNVAANKAKDKIEKEINKRTSQALSEASRETHLKVNHYLIPNEHRMYSAKAVLLSIQ